MATIVGATGGGSWTTAGTWTGGVVPTSADDVQLNGTSGNVTISSGAVCRSLDCTGYTGTLTHTAAVTLGIGDATAGTGNVALKMVSGMTYTVGSTTTSIISFNSTSATVQTITSGGKTLSSWTIANVGCSYQLADSNTVAATSTVTVTGGTFSTNGQTCNWGTFSSSNSNVRSISLGASAITITGAVSNAAWFFAVPTNLTFSAGTSTITMTGSAAGIQTGSQSYNNLIMSGSASMLLYGAATFVNFTRTGTAVRGDGLQVQSNFTVTGTINLNGNSSINRLYIFSSVLATSRTITAANVSASNLDLADITGAGAGSWNLTAISGLSGDCGGNSGMTLTTAATQTWSGTSGGNWSSNAWTTRVPLPQDDVVISTAFTASQTVVADMSRLGKNISWAGTTGAPTWNFGSVANTIFGSITLVSGMATSGGQAVTLSARVNSTITCAGCNINPSITITAIGTVTYTLQDNYVSTAGLSLNSGGINANNFNVTAGLFASNTTNTRTITMGSGTWTFSVTTATIWSISVITGLTFSGSNASIVIGSPSSTSRTFVGGGLSYGNLNHTYPSSSGSLVITGANTFNSIIFSDAANGRTLTLPASTTTTIISQFSVVGTAGKLMTINSSTGGTAATLSKSGAAVSCEYISLQDSTATGGATWYAGAHSTAVSNVTGWTMTAKPLISGNFELFE